MSIIIGIDHGYYAIKTAHCSFPAGLTSYGEHEPYTRQGLLEFGGCFFVCGSGRQPIQRDKTANDNYYLLTLAAIAKEIRQRGLPPECSVRIAAGLPLTSFGRDKPKFKDYLLRSNQPVNYKFEGVEYSITIEEVAIFPQGYAALMTETGLLQDEPSMLLMDLGGWTVDLMRIDNAIPAADTAHRLELGMIRCVDDIREQVRRETGLSLTDAQIENMLAGQPCTVSDTVRDIVNKQGRIIRDIQLSEENLKKCRYERLSEIFPRIMFYSYATVKTTKETGGFNMNQQTNENNSTSCSYQELNPEMDAFLQGYLEEGRRKGLQESTIHLHDKIGHYFLFAMTETGCLKPQEMNAQNVGIACLKISSRWYLSHIRTFLRYAYQSGNTDRDYSGIVPLFKIPQPYPSVYTAEEIQKIENSVDQSSPHGKRDYAALLLATRLGIRSGDISSMTLECLDFERDLIRLTQHKTGVFIEFPMVSDVKVALERYLQEERTAYDSPYVFLRIVPPYGHISVQAIAKIARTAIAVAGIEPGGRKQGAHAFRSSLASSMINDNIPYEAVRKILGHTDQNAIRSYARLDMEQLRGYALPVMEATGIFAEFLEGRWSLS